MEKLININAKIVIISYILIDIICAGAGMGVPFFCILLGFPLGWYIARRVYASAEQPHREYYKIFKFSFFAAVVTFTLMLIIWGSAVLIHIIPKTNHETQQVFSYKPMIGYGGHLVNVVRWD